jgi:hypothetical protein
VGRVVLIPRQHTCLRIATGFDEASPIFIGEALGKGAMYVMGVAGQEPREQNKERASDGRRCKGCVMRKQPAASRLDDARRPREFCSS